MRDLLPAMTVLILLAAGTGAARADQVCKLTDTSPQRPIAVGIEYRPMSADCRPDPVFGTAETPTPVHVAVVDLSNPSLAIKASRPVLPDVGGKDTGTDRFRVRLTTSVFGVLPPSRDPAPSVPQVAINANLFTNCCTDTADDPKREDTLLRGLEAVDGIAYSPPLANSTDLPAAIPPTATFASSLLVGAGGRAEIATLAAGSRLPEGTRAAVTGSHLIVDGGENVVADAVPQGCTDPCRSWLGANARTAVGLRDHGSRLLLVVVDGQDGGPKGVTLYQIGDILAQLGADRAINLDGGGSSTMAVRDPATGYKVLNALYDHQSDDGRKCTVPAGNVADCERYVGTVLSVEAPSLP